MTTKQIKQIVNQGERHTLNHLLNSIHYGVISDFMLIMSHTSSTPIKMVGLNEAHDLPASTKREIVFGKNESVITHLMASRHVTVAEKNHAMNGVFPNEGGKLVAMTTESRFAALQGIAKSVHTSETELMNLFLAVKDDALLSPVIPQIAGNPNATPQLLWGIYSTRPDDMTSTISIATNLAADVDTPPSILTELSNHRNVTVRQKVAGNRNTTDKTLRDMVVGKKETDGIILLNAAKNMKNYKEECGVELFDYILQARDDTKKAALKAAAENGLEGFSRYQVEVMESLGIKMLPKGVIRDVQKAESLTTIRQELINMACHSYPEVREAVTANPNADVVVKRVVKEYESRIAVVEGGKNTEPAEPVYDGGVSVVGENDNSIKP